VHPVFKGLNPLYIPFFSVVQEAKRGTRGGVWTSVKIPPPHRGSNPEPSSP